MREYEQKILNTLIDSYENSVLARGANKRAVHIAFSFDKNTIPEYFDESSLCYEGIHSQLKGLEQKGFIRIIWRKGKEGHIIEKVLLNETNITPIYRVLHRMPKSTMERQHLEALEAMAQKYQTPIAAKFIRYLSERIAKGESVKKYVDLSDVNRTEKIVRAIALIEQNEQECYIREFSIRYFGDSKILESLLPVIGTIMRSLDAKYADMENYDIIAEHGIYHTPNYVYIKGNLTICKVEESVNKGIDLSFLNQGMGISGEDLEHIRILANEEIRYVFTIENLTTFFRFQKEKSIVIYLGGYHNSVRRKLLKLIYGQLPDAKYYHFGDIDVGGFEIYEDLCRKTNIPFQLFHMEIAELQNYENYTKPLTENDKRRLKHFMEKNPGCAYIETLRYMSENNVKLEQEWYEVDFGAEGQ